MRWPCNTDPLGKTYEIEIMYTGCPCFEFYGENNNEQCNALMDEDYSEVQDFLQYDIPQWKFGGVSKLHCKDYAQNSVPGRSTEASILYADLVAYEVTSPEDPSIVFANGILTQGEKFTISVLESDDRVVQFPPFLNVTFYDAAGNNTDGQRRMLQWSLIPSSCDDKSNFVDIINHNIGGMMLHEIVTENYTVSWHGRSEYITKKYWENIEDAASLIYPTEDNVFDWLDPKFRAPASLTFPTTITSDHNLTFTFVYLGIFPVIGDLPKAVMIPLSDVVSVDDKEDPSSPSYAWTFTFSDEINLQDTRSYWIYSRIDAVDPETGDTCMGHKFIHLFPVPI